MKIAVISDTHLFNRLDKRKYNYLKKLYEEYDQVIINGDLWDGYVCSFNKFIRSKWKILFPIMKDKTIYIYGNHDRRQWQDDRNLQFCKLAVNEYLLKLPNGRKLNIQHGHLFLFPLFDTLTQKRPVVALTKPFYAFSNFEEKFMIKLFGWKGLNLVLNGDNHLRNEKLSIVARSRPEVGVIHVFSHTHIAMFDIVNRHINTGAIRFGLSSYLHIEDNSLRIISERY